mmetsp:Transcript_28208/g.41528  ORF Transcript_28208/g.41528 Transcript_28208/m.41528 type:complete len:206 (-) Transcript_28208:535-1152(-)
MNRPVPVGINSVLAACNSITLCRAARLNLSMSRGEYQVRPNSSLERRNSQIQMRGSKATPLVVWMAIVGVGLEVGVLMQQSSSAIAACSSSLHSVEAREGMDSVDSSELLGLAAETSSLFLTKEEGFSIGSNGVVLTPDSLRAFVFLYGLISRNFRLDSAGVKKDVLRLFTCLSFLVLHCLTPQGSMASKESPSSSLFSSWCSVR